MTVSEQIIQVLDALCEKFGLVIDWTSENVVPYLTVLATKLISYEIWTSVAWMIIALTIFVIAVNLIRKHKQTLTDFDDCIWIPIGVFGGGGGLFAIGAIIVNIMDIIKCLTFPEMYVFEYIQNMINAAH